MVQTPNQRLQNTEQGQVDLLINPAIISGQIAAAETASLVPGSPIKLSDVAGAVPQFLLATADTDVIFGYIVRNIKDITLSARDICEVAYDGSVMYMTAGAAIARGARVEADVSAIKVITAANVNPIAGLALDKASADGDLIRVLILTPAASATVYGTSVISYSAGAGALPITARNIMLTTTGVEALTLANGIEGQELTILMIVDGGTATLTPASYFNGTTITFDDIKDVAELVFLNGKWNNKGTPTATIA